MKVKCKCGYEWNTESKLENVSCPSCLQKVKIRITEKVSHPKEEDPEIDETKESQTEAVEEQRKKYLEE